MPPPPPQRCGMSTFDKMKMGAVMGTCVGLTMGFIFGGYTIMKHGAGPNGVIRSLGQYMLGSAATFGFFMSIGTAIRTEGIDGEKARIWNAVSEKAREERRKVPVIVEARPVLSGRWAAERRRREEETERA